MVTGGVMTPGTSIGQVQFDAAELRAVVERAHELGLRVAAHAHPEERTILARHDAFVGIAVGRLQPLDPDIADAQEFLEGRIEDGEGLLDQLIHAVEEHRREGGIARLDDAVLRHDDADGRAFECQFVEGRRCHGS